MSKKLTDLAVAVGVALAEAGVTVYYTGIEPDLAELWLTPLASENPKGERDGVVLKWLPTGWQMVQLVEGREAETRRVGLALAAPADVARAVAQAMAIDEPATQEPDDWSQLAARLHEVADQLATLAGRGVMPPMYASLTIGVRGLPHLEAQAVPALAAIAAALGTTVTETEPSGQPPAWYHIASVSRGGLDVQALSRVTRAAGGAQ